MREETEILNACINLRLKSHSVDRTLLKIGSAQYCAAVAQVDFSIKNEDGEVLLTL